MLEKIDKWNSDRCGAWRTRLEASGHCRVECLPRFKLFKCCTHTDCPADRTVVWPILDTHTVGCQKATAVPVWPAFQQVRHSPCNQMRASTIFVPGCRHLTSLPARCQVPGQGRADCTRAGRLNEMQTERLIRDEAGINWLNVTRMRLHNRLTINYEMTNFTTTATATAIGPTADAVCIIWTVRQCIVHIHWHWSLHSGQGQGQGRGGGSSSVSWSSRNQWQSWFTCGCQLCVQVNRNRRTAGGVARQSRGQGRLV